MTRRRCRCRWVVSSATTDPQLTNAARFNHSRSATYAARSPPLPFHIEYGSGSVSGTRGSDVVTFAGRDIRNVTFGEVVSGTVADGFGADGILGMSFRELDEYGGFTVFDLLLQQVRSSSHAVDDVMQMSNAVPWCHVVTRNVM
jgi:hypothetical protein